MPKMLASLELDSLFKEFNTELRQPVYAMTDRLVSTTLYSKQELDNGNCVCYSTGWDAKGTSSP